ARSEVFAVSNDPVLLLHGQPGAAADWEPLRAALGDAVRAIAIDRPGWSRREPVTDLIGNVQAAVAALDRAGVQRATVVGHSRGAQAAGAGGVARVRARAALPGPRPPGARAAPRPDLGSHHDRGRHW